MPFWPAPAPSRAPISTAQLARCVRTGPGAWSTRGASPPGSSQVSCTLRITCLRSTWREPPRAQAQQRLLNRTPLDLAWHDPIFHNSNWPGPSFWAGGVANALATERGTMCYARKAISLLRSLCEATLPRQRPGTTGPGIAALYALRRPSSLARTVYLALIRERLVYRPP